MTSRIQPAPIRREPVRFGADPVEDSGEESEDTLVLKAGQTWEDEVPSKNERYHHRRPWRVGDYFRAAGTITLVTVAIPIAIPIAVCYLGYRAIRYRKDFVEGVKDLRAGWINHRIDKARQKHFYQEEFMTTLPRRLRHTEKLGVDSLEELGTAVFSMSQKLDQALFSYPPKTSITLKSDGAAYVGDKLLLSNKRLAGVLLYRFHYNKPKAPAAMLRLVSWIREVAKFKPDLFPDFTARDNGFDEVVLEPKSGESKHAHNDQKKYIRKNWY